MTTATATATPATTAQAATPSAKPLSPIGEVRQELDRMKDQIALVLPPHVTPEKFMRIALTAIQQQPALLGADRKSLFAATMKSAQDGLLPDGREAAFVVYRTKNRDTSRYEDKVQYLPMVFGVLKKVRNSGELKSIAANVVYEKDEFRYFVDDVGEHVLHEPNVLVEDRGRLLAVYAVATTKDGGRYVEVMSRGQIEQVRQVSRAKDSGPWVQWYDEMARKTVIRRLSKRLPMSTDLEQVLRRDDDHYDLNGGGAQGAVAAKSGAAAAKALLGLSDGAFGQPAIAYEAEAAGEPAAGSVAADVTVPSIAEAEQMLKEAGSLDDLKAAWKDLCATFASAHLEVPLQVEATYQAQREQFEVAARTGAAKK